jgi:hypothetical protein
VARRGNGNDFRGMDLEEEPQGGMGFCTCLGRLKNRPLRFGGALRGGLGSRYWTARVSGRVRVTGWVAPVGVNVAVTVSV